MQEKTCCPQSNEQKAFCCYLHGLRIPKIYSYLAPPLGPPSLLSVWSTIVIIKFHDLSDPMDFGVYVGDLETNVRSTNIGQPV